MRIEKIFCDRCGNEIPKVTEMNIWGHEVERYRLGKLDLGFPFHDIDLSRYGTDICEKCAFEVSILMRDQKAEMIGGDANGTLKE